MENKLKALLDQTGQIVIDGSMSTALEQLGANLNHKLWTAKALAEQPELVKQVHMDYFKAGADCGITCSYQATIPGLMECGYTKEEAVDIIRRSVTVFKEARDEWWESEGKNQNRPYPLCLAGIGPYGAYLADGSEYTGDYDISEEDLITFHKERMEILWEAGADILLIETQPSFKEALIAAKLAEDLNAPYWISFSCKDEAHINDGTPIKECGKVLSKDHPGLCCIGINCSKPEHVSSLIRELKQSSTLPIAVYPNSGEVYDATTKTWSGPKDAGSFEDFAFEYFNSGADAVGGCCTTNCNHVTQIVAAKKRFQLR